MLVTTPIRDMASPNSDSDFLSSMISHNSSDGEGQERDDENEMKYVPPSAVVKTEISYSEGNSNYDEILDDPILRPYSIKNELFADTSKSGDVNEEDTITSGRSKRKSTRVRRPIDPDSDDPEDEHWTTWTSKRKKRKTPAKRGKAKRSNASGSSKGLTEDQKRSREAERKRARKAAMTDEELVRHREKERERSRRRRERERQQKQMFGSLQDLVDDKAEFSLDGHEQDEYYDCGTDVERKTRKKKISGASRILSTSSTWIGPPGQRRKKRVSEMTPDELERKRAQWKAQKIRRRQREAQIRREGNPNAILTAPPWRKKYVSEMTPEELEAQREINRERRRRLRSQMTADQRDEFNRRNRERQAQRRANMTEEERQELKQRQTLLKLEKMANMTDDEKQAYEFQKFLRYAAKKSRISEEYRAKREALTEEERDKMKEDRRQWYKEQMKDPDKRKRWLEKQREYHKRRMERIKQDPHKADELKKYFQQKNRERRERKGLPVGVRKRTNFGSAPRGSRSLVKRDTSGDGLDERRFKRALVKRQHESLNEYHDRVADQRKRKNKQARVNRRLKIQSLLDNGMSMEEISRNLETPQQRQRRLMKIRIYSAKKRLRLQLEARGVHPEVIQAKLSEVDQTYQGTQLEFKQYRPRNTTLEKVDSSDEENPLPQPRDCQSPIRTQPCLAFKERVQPLSQEEAKVNTVQPHNLLLPPQAPPCSSNSSSGYQVPDLSLQVTSGPLTHPQHTQYAHQHLQTFHLQSILEAAVNFPESHHVTAPMSAPTDPFNPQSYMNQDHYSSSYYDDDNQSVRSAGASPAPSLSCTEVPFIPGINYATTKPEAQQPLPASALEQFRQQHPTQWGWNNLAVEPPDIPPERNPKRVKGPGPGRSRFHTKGQKHKRAEACPPRGPWPLGRGKQKPKEGEEDDPATLTVCDECGLTYKKGYIGTHKELFHNPYFKDFRCLLCGPDSAEYRTGSGFRNHYKKVHQIPKQLREVDNRPYICEECGRSYKEAEPLRRHVYLTHGDGSKKENYVTCPVCAKRIKCKYNLNNHMKKMHPNTCSVECGRCDQTFKTDGDLRIHVQGNHPGCFNACQFCNAYFLTATGLRFHYFRCQKVPSREARKKVISEFPPEIPIIRELKLVCEVCSRQVVVAGMSQHVLGMHGVQEVLEFFCWVCNRMFKRREFLVAHLHERHEIEWSDEMRDKVSKMNLPDGAELKNLEGLDGAVPFSTPRKLKEEQERQMQGKTKQTRTVGGRKKKGRIMGPRRKPGRKSRSESEKKINQGNLPKLRGSKNGDKRGGGRKQNVGEEDPLQSESSESELLADSDVDDEEEFRNKTGMRIHNECKVTCNPKGHYGTRAATRASRKVGGGRNDEQDNENGDVSQREGLAEEDINVNVKEEPQDVTYL